MLGSNDNPGCLDVRESEEVSVFTIQGFIHIRIDEVKENIEKLPKNKKWHIYYHHKGRGHCTMEALSSQGITAINLQGGINTWSLKTETQVACY